MIFFDKRLISSKTVRRLTKRQQLSKLMMKKILTKLGILLTIISLSAFVTACGGADDGGGTTDDDKSGGDANGS